MTDSIENGEPTAIPVGVNPYNTYGLATQGFVWAAISSVSGNFDGRVKTVNKLLPDETGNVNVTSIRTEDYSGEVNEIHADLTVLSGDKEYRLLTNLDYDSLHNYTDARIEQISGDIEEDFAVIASASGGWNDTQSKVESSSDNWDSVYSTVESVSSNWESVYSTIQEASGGWENVKHEFESSSGGWNDTQTKVETSSDNWDSTFSTVSSLSGDWNSAATSFGEVSATAYSVYNAVESASGGWNDTQTKVESSSGNWGSVYSTVDAFSADWSNKQDALSDVQISAINSVVGERKTYLDFGSEDISAFDWEGTLTINEMADAGLYDNNSKTWIKRPIKVNVGTAVTAISGAFAGDNALTTVYIPGIVSNVGYTAFYKCNKLKSVTIEEGVVTIGSNTFGSCSTIEKITLPKSLVNIGNAAFSGCTALSSIDIPENVSYVGSNVFSNCTSLFKARVIGRSQSEAEALLSGKVPEWCTIEAWNAASQEWVESRLLSSDNWDSTYSTVNGLSANWNDTYRTSETYTKTETDEQINRLAAYYITYNANGDAFPSYEALTSAQSYYSGGQIRIPTRNDYAVVLHDEIHDGSEWRYIYSSENNDDVWEAQYPIETNDYNALDHKPKINNVELVGNISLATLGVKPLQEPVTGATSITSNDIRFVTNITQDSTGVISVSSDTVRTANAMRDGVVRFSTDIYDGEENDAKTLPTYISRTALLSAVDLANEAQADADSVFSTVSSASADWERSAIVDNNNNLILTNTPDGIAIFSTVNAFVQANSTSYGDVNLGTKGYCILELRKATNSILISGDIGHTIDSTEYIDGKTIGEVIGGDVALRRSLKDGTTVNTAKFSDLVWTASAFSFFSHFGSITSIESEGNNTLLKFDNFPFPSSVYNKTQEQFIAEFNNGGDNALYVAGLPLIGNTSISAFVSQHVEGGSTKAIGQYTHSEGRCSIADGKYSHAEGNMSVAGGASSHAEGQQCCAYGNMSHAEGTNTFTIGNYSHAEGTNSKAYGDCAHAAGYYATANNDYSWCWNGDKTVSNYAANSDGVFCINPKNGLGGFFIGNVTLNELLNAKEDKLSTERIKAIDSIVDERATKITFANGTVSSYNWEDNVSAVKLYEAGLRGSSSSSTGTNPEWNENYKITDIVFGTAINTISNAAFYKNDTLSSISFNENLSVLKKNAFLNVPNLSAADIVLPKTISTVGGAVFRNSNVRNVIVKGKTLEEANALLSNAGLPENCNITTWNDASQEWVETKMVSSDNWDSVYTTTYTHSSAWGTGLQPTISKTWSELINLRDNEELIPGASYRITDYVATTVQNSTSSAQHGFDLIVFADSASSLNEVAHAALRAGDTYFSGCNLNAWKIWYCLDNDTTRFAWADSSTKGRGVIYRMIDEWGNDVPYDFKGIVFDGYAYTFYNVDDNVDASIDGYANSTYDNVISPYVKDGKRYIGLIYFYNNCNCNEIGMNCDSIYIGKNSTNIKIGNDCTDIIFGDMEFGPKPNYKYITFEDGIRHVYLKGNASGNDYYMNVTVSKGVCGTDEMPKTIVDNNLNQNYKTVYQSPNAQFISV